jgi:hypothetical protein
MNQALYAHMNKKKKLKKKIKKNKIKCVSWAGGMAQVAEHLLSKHKV